MSPRKIKERLAPLTEEFGSEILGLTYLFFHAVSYLTMGLVYRLFRVPPSEITFRHAEFYLVSTTLLLVTLIFGSQFVPGLGWVTVVLGNLRVIQILCLNLNTILFDATPIGSTAGAAAKRARWHFVAIGFSFVDTVLIFGFLFQFLDHHYHILNISSQSYLHYLYYAIVTIATIGYGDIHPISLLGKGLVMYEAMVSLIFLIFFVTGAVGRLQRHV